MQKQLKSGFLLFFLILSCITHAQEWKLVWSDEFDGTEIDLNNWSYETGRGQGGNWGTGQVDYATDKPENIKVENGKLIITLRNEGAPDNSTTRPYTSGRIMSYRKQEFTYGKIEAKIKGPYSQGQGFAFWLLGADYKSVSWPKCGEIDIAEITGKTPSYNIGTAHFQQSYGHAQSQGSYTLSDGKRFADDFHVFGIEWTKTHIKWYIDGELYHTFDTSGAINGYRPFDRPFFIILSAGVGGTYSGAPDQTTVFPMPVEIDWVRVYQQENTAPTLSFSDLKMFDEIPAGNFVVNTKAFDAEDNLDYVEFFINNISVSKVYDPPYQYNWNNISDGCYKITAIARDTHAEYSATALSFVKVGQGCTQTPYKGIKNIPGKIEAEDYDKGKNGFAYYDTDVTNKGGKYRLSEEVDIAECNDTDGGYYVGWTMDNEFLTYSVNTEEDGEYMFSVRTEGTSEGILNIKMPANNINQQITLQPTGNNTWKTTTINFPLKAGNDILKVEIIKGGQLMNWYSFETVPTGIEKVNLSPIIYPNPVKDILNLDLNDPNATIIISDINGRKLQEEKAVKYIDMSSYEPGMYILCIQLSTGERKINKIIKQ